MKQRIITGVIAGALFLALLYIGQLPFSILVTLIGCIAFYEVVSMLKGERVLMAEILGMISVVLLVLHDDIAHWWINLSFESIWLSLTILLLLISIFTNNKFHYVNVAFISFSVFYIGLSFHFFILARHIGIGIILFILIASGVIGE